MVNVPGSRPPAWVSTAVPSAATAMGRPTGVPPTLNCTVPDVTGAPPAVTEPARPTSEERRMIGNIVRHMGAPKPR